uniref:Uncharacterized protein n=1 Tax=Micrurus lemniscatus lemniscatus TaxID=129467 RepID=A0A2D4IRH4_MICLE
MVLKSKKGAPESTFSMSGCYGKQHALDKSQSEEYDVLQSPYYFIKIHKQMFRNNLKICNEQLFFRFIIQYWICKLIEQIMIYDMTSSKRYEPKFGTGRNFRCVLHINPPC